jgi:hypothetical protein
VALVVGSFEGVDWESGLVDTDMGDGISTDMGGDESSVGDAAEGHIESVVASLREVEALEPEQWSELERPERLEVLQDIEARVAEIQGRPAVPVAAEAMQSGCYGGYSRGEGIVLSDEHLMSNDIIEITDTVVHEGRHAYQDYAIQTPGFVSDDGLIATWRDNWDNYLTAEEYGQELYVAQPVESDAWEYSARIRAALFGTGE